MNLRPRASRPRKQPTAFDKIGKHDEAVSGVRASGRGEREVNRNEILALNCPAADLQLPETKLRLVDIPSAFSINSQRKAASSVLVKLAHTVRPHHRRDGELEIRKSSERRIAPGQRGRRVATVIESALAAPRKLAIAIAGTIPIRSLCILNLSIVTSIGSLLLRRNWERKCAPKVPDPQSVNELEETADFLGRSLHTF